MQNQNPYFQKGFVEDMAEQQGKGVFLRACAIIQSRFDQGVMSKEDFFQIAQFSYFPHKLTGQSTNFRLFKHYDPSVLRLVSSIVPQLQEQEMASVLFLYANNMWEAQERFTYAETFFKPLFAHLASSLRHYSNQTMSNLLKSIGTLCYRDCSVDLVLEDAQRRAVLGKDLQMIQTLVATSVNIGSSSFKDDASMKMLEVFSQEYQERQDKGPKASTKGHAEYERGQ